MIIIGIGGKAHSGKDTVADILVKDYGFTKMAFADSLKEMVHRHYNFGRDELWTDYKSKEVRRILQGTGELIKSLEGENFWIHKIQEKIVYGSMTPGWLSRIVISDLRFPNEERYIKQCSGGITVKINRPEVEEIEFNPGHISEAELQDFDYTILNNRSIMGLEWEVDRVMKNENISRCTRLLCI